MAARSNRRRIRDDGERGLPNRDLLAFDRDVSELVANAILSRSQFAQKMGMDSRRDIDRECGYPKTDELTAQRYKDTYERDAIAVRVVEVYANATWSESPTVYEDEDVDTVTKFEEAWDGVAKSVNGDSRYKTEKGSPIWEFLKRLDILSGIGSFGVGLLGIDDGKPLSESVDGIDAQGGRKGNLVERKLTFIRPFDESQVTIAACETDVKNRRYGQPVSYSLTLADPRDAMRGGFGISSTSATVHWTRIIHVADGLRGDDAFGTPRMRSVINHIINLQKLYGASPEGYWKHGLPLLSLELDPRVDPRQAKANTTNIKRMMEDAENSLQRYLYLKGLTARQIASNLSDPTPHIEAQISAICIALECPRRVFEGSERGELASSQDAGAWDGRVNSRRNLYVTPRIIVPLVDRLILLGVLPEPEEYTVKWPERDAMDAAQKSQVALTKTDAMVKYVQGGLEALLPPKVFLTSVLDFDDDMVMDALAEAEAMVAEEEAQAAEAVQVQAEADAAKAEELAKQQPPVSPEQPAQSPSRSRQVPPQFQKEAGKTESPFERPVTHGGAGSGNFGHSGRPGEVGGSGEGGGGGGTAAKESPRSGAGGGAEPPDVSGVLGVDAKKAFFAYSESTFEDINSPLRDGDSLDGYAKDVATALSSAIEKYGKFPEPIAVYRGMGWNNSDTQNEFLKQAVEGREIQMAGFSSTTLDRSVAESFAADRPNGVLVKVIANRGIRMNDGLTNVEKEKEVLLDHNSAFKVVSRDLSGKPPVIVLEQTR